MLELPVEEQNPISLSDWLELRALSSSDGNSSAGDLISALKIIVDGNRAEQLSLEVMAEIERRAMAAMEAYPFSIASSGVIEVKGDWREYVAYIFCLCLAYFRWKQVQGATINPWLLFEELSAIAAKQYINGNVFHFGAAAAIGTGPFQTAVNELCRQLGEGEGFYKQPTLRRKDDKVDLVAFRHFADQRESKLIMFGQCAAGENWSDKLTELDPDAFWKQWIQRGCVSPLVKSFYIPFRVQIDEFQHAGRKCGILFDRCRIAHCAWSANDEVVSDGRYATWCLSVFPELDAQPFES